MKKLIITLLVLLSLKCFSQNSTLSWVQAEKFGYRPDGRIVSDAAITSGQSTLTSSTANFTAADVGKKVCIQGAGASSVNLIATISGFTNATTVTINTTAGHTVSSSGCDIGTDNTTPVQNMWNYFVGQGGAHIEHGPGLALFFGALQTSVNSVNPNCQVYIPLTNISSSAVTMLDLHGVFMPNLLSPLQSGTDLNIYQKCTVWKSEIVGSGTTPALIGSPYYTPSGFSSTYNFTSVYMDGFLFQTKSKVNNIDVAGTMSCVNLYDLSQGRLNNVGAYTESYIYGGVLPVNKTYGFILPKFLNNAVSGIDWAFVWNYNTGYKITEHSDCGQLTAVCDSIAVESTNGNIGNPTVMAHAARIRHLQAEDNVINVVSTGQSSLYISTLSCERATTAFYSGKWFLGGTYEYYFPSSADSSMVFVTQYDNGESGTGAILYDIKTNNSTRIKVKYNYNLDVDNSLINIAYGTAITWDVKKCKNAQIIMTNNTGVLTINNLAVGDKILLKCVQDNTGSRGLTFPANSLFQNGITFSVAPNQADLFEGLFDGTYIIWKTTGQFTQTAVSPVTSFLTALAANGYTPGGTEAVGYTTFYNSAVSNGYWTKIKALYIFAGSTAGTHKLNFVNPADADAAYRITWNGTVTHTSGTITSDGTTGYGDSHFNPSTQLTFPAGAITGWFTNSALPGSIGVYTGTTSPLPATFILNDFSSGGVNFATIGDAGAGNFIQNTGASDGCFTISRTSSSAMGWYRNGSSLSTNSTTPSSFPNGNMLICARLQNGVPGSFGANPIIFVAISDGLTSTDATNFYNDLLALKTAMGK